METLTPRQKSICDAIRRLAEKHGRPIRRVEIETELGIKRSGQSLLSLVAAGHITRYPRVGYLPADVTMVLQ